MNCQCRKSTNKAVADHPLSTAYCRGSLQADVRSLQLHTAYDPRSVPPNVLHARNPRPSSCHTTASGPGERRDQRVHTSVYPEPILLHVRVSRYSHPSSNHTPARRYGRLRDQQQHSGSNWGPLPRYVCGPWPPDANHVSRQRAYSSFDPRSLRPDVRGSS